MGTHGKAEKTHQSSGKQDKHDLKPIYIYIHNRRNGKDQFKVQ
jgi:hypothetical protein